MWPAGTGSGGWLNPWWQAWRASSPATMWPGQTPWRKRSKQAFPTRRLRAMQSPFQPLAPAGGSSKTWAGRRPSGCFWRPEIKSAPFWFGRARPPQVSSLVHGRWCLQRSWLNRLLLHLRVLLAVDQGLCARAGRCGQTLQNPLLGQRWILHLPLQHLPKPAGAGEILHRWVRNTKTSTKRPPNISVAVCTILPCPKYFTSVWIRSLFCEHVQRSWKIRNLDADGVMRISCDRNPNFFNSSD